MATERPEAACTGAHRSPRLPLEFPVCPQQWRACPHPGLPLHWTTTGSPPLPASSSWPESLTTVPCTCYFAELSIKNMWRWEGSIAPGWASSSSARQKDHADQIGLLICWVLNKHGSTVGSKRNLLIIKRENRLQDQITQQTHPWDMSHIASPLQTLHTWLYPEESLWIGWLCRELCVPVSTQSQMMWQFTANPEIMVWIMENLFQSMLKSLTRWGS